MTCERCGNDFADGITICPRCGTPKSQSYTKQPVTDYGSFGPGNPGDIPLYQQGHIPLPLVLHLHTRSMCHLDPHFPLSILVYLLGLRLDRHFILLLSILIRR
jgi:hypothetical protein